MGVPDVPSTVKNFTAGEIYASGAGLLKCAHKRATVVCIYASDTYAVCEKETTVCCM